MDLALRIFCQVIVGVTPQVAPHDILSFFHFFFDCSVVIRFYHLAVYSWDKVPHVKKSIILSGILKSTCVAASSIARHWRKIDGNKTSVKTADQNPLRDADSPGAVHDAVQAVGDGEDSAVRELCADGFLNQVVCLQINSCCGLIQD